MTRHSISWRSLVATALVLVALFPWQGAPPALADIEGDTYTSPLYGYSVTWDQSWFVVEEVTADFDSLTVTNGLTYATFIGAPDTATTLESALATLVIAMRSDRAVGDVTPLPGDRGDVTGGNTATAAFAFPLTMPDGLQVDVVGYLEARLLIPGSAILGLMAYSPAARFDSQLPLIQRLVAGLRMPGDEPDPPTEPDPARTIETSMPIFASDRWRVAVVTSALIADSPAVGLESQPGKEWLVVVLDVTNWSDITSITGDDPALPLRDFTLTVDGVDKPFKTTPHSTRNVAAAMGAVQPSDELVLRIAPDETVRVALVYSLPARSGLLELHHAETAFPLASTLTAELDPSTLPPPAAAPAVERATLVSALDGRTIRVQLDGETKSRRIRLLGVTPPEKGACMEHGAETLLDKLAGQTVLVETDAALADDTSTERYVWLVGDDGRRTLLNRRLIAEGRAMAENIPREASVEIWMKATERVAKAKKIGLWAPCTSS